MSIVILILLGLLMGYSRVFITKCHTIQQVIVGSILGIGFGYLYTIYTCPLIRDWYNEIKIINYFVFFFLLYFK